MKPIHYLIYVLTLAVGVGVGRVWQWYVTPLGCPMCICPKPALDPGYVDLWLPFVLVAVYAVIVMTVIAAALCGLWWEHHRANEK
jgi:hypothetical protein